ncbi:hypothetical protein Dimus_020255, partial [Dionaea muscipula]
NLHKEAEGAVAGGSSPSTLGRPYQLKQGAKSAAEKRARNLASPPETATREKEEEAAINSGGQPRGGLHLEQGAAPINWRRGDKSAAARGGASSSRSRLLPPSCATSGEREGRGPTRGVLGQCRSGYDSPDPPPVGAAPPPAALSEPHSPSPTDPRSAAAEAGDHHQICSDSYPPRCPPLPGGCCHQSTITEEESPPELFTAIQ